MPHKPIFTVVTPSYNQAPFIKDTLDSIRTQSFTSFEHLVYDPGSTDGSVEIIDAYCQGFEPAEFFLGQDKSQTHAINLGYDRAQGEILCWLNSDDAYYDEDVLKAVHQTFTQNPDVDVVYGRGQYVTPEGEVLRDAYINRDGPNIFQQMSQSLGILQPSLFMRQRVFDLAGPLDEKMNFSFDYEYWVRCASRGAKFHFLDKILSRAVIHEDAKTMRARGTSLQESVTVAKRYYDFVAADWVQRVADYQLNQNDGIINTVVDDTALKQKAQELFFEENTNGPALTQYFNESPLMGAKTRANFGELVEKVFDNAYLSGWDENYFDMGVTLLASIHRNTPNRFVFVYDLGMTAEQRAFLKLLKGVILLETDFVPFTQDWQRHPKNYVFKITLFNHLLGMLPQDCALLWVDAGVMLMQEPSVIFQQLRKDNSFFIDHSDSRHWPLYNASFTSDAAIQAGEFTYAELSGPHVCSCLFGCVVGSKAQRVFTLAAKMAESHAISVGDKHPPNSEKRTALPKAEQTTKASELAKNTNLVGDLNALRKIFGYYGHRQDQSIVSLLVTRFKLPISSAATFCPSNDESSKISTENWFEGVSSNLGGYAGVPMEQSGVTFHHRGLVKDFSGICFEFPRQSVAGILGNGPSLAEITLPELSDTDGFGMNAAYRFWEKISWYPSFYCCLDTVVGMSHKEAIRNLVRARKRHGIKAFLIRQNLVDWLAETGDIDGVINFDLIRFGVQPFLAEPVTTGSHSLAWGLWMGYRNAFVAGVDCNYVEKIEGAEATKAGTLQITNDGDNPNYFFKDYQRVGDAYNIPNPSKDLHIRSWRNVGAYLHGDVKIFNVSAASRMDAFPKISLEEAFSHFGHNKMESNFLTRLLDSTHEVPPSLLLTVCSSALLLEPENTLTDLKDGTKLSTAIKKALSSLPSDHDIRSQYNRVESYTRKIQAEKRVETTS